MKIGVDVGGTNTDAVIMGPAGVAGWCKTPTTADVFSGIVQAITRAKEEADVDAADIDCVMIGTTQFTQKVGCPYSKVQFGTVGFPSLTESLSLYHYRQ